MKALFIGLVIVTLIAGVVAKSGLGSGKHPSFVGEFLTFIGLKKSTQQQEEKVNELLEQSKKNQAYADYLKNQKDYLTYSRGEIGGLSTIIQNMSDQDKQFDILHVKELMRQFEDQNLLLLENGDRLLEEHQRQMRVNEQIKKQLALDTSKSKAQQEQLYENYKNNLRLEQERMERQLEDTKLLHDKIQEIKDQLKQKQEDAVSAQKMQALNKLDSLSSKTDSYMDSIKQKREEIQDMKRRNEENLETMKRNMQDARDRNADLLNRNNSIDKTREMNDRIKDQIQRIKDQRTR